MRRPLPRILAIVLCLAVVFTPGPMKAKALGGDGVKTYRALLIGNTQYDGAQSLRAPRYDVDHMEQLLLQQDIGGSRFAGEHITKLLDATKLAMLEAIRTELAGETDADDVTYFYYSGHGTFDGTTSYLVGVESGLLSAEELKAALDAVPGQKVVILDCCYSGGYAGRAPGAARPLPPKMKDTGGSAALMRAMSASAEREQFQNAVMKPFTAEKTPAQRSLASSGYKVIAAASPFQYSYEYRFSGSGGYGPRFRMNGTDWAGGAGNYSGEFTGMLVAGAGRVSFNDVFPEIKALADADRDRRVTMDELYRYLRGAVLYSTVQAYPEEDGTVLFQHAETDAPDWDRPALFVEDNGAEHAPSDGEPLRIRMLCNAGWGSGVAIRRMRMIGDNQYADNADAETLDVAALAVEGSLPDGAETTLFWDGGNLDGSAAGDGWYFAELVGGGYLYPPVPFELRRGISNFPGAAALPVNTTFSASLGNGTTKWYSFTPSADGLLQVESVNGSDSRNPQAELCDADGNSLAWSDDSGGADRDFRLLRCLKAGQRCFIGLRLSDGDSAVSVLARFITPSANNALKPVATSATSYTLFRPDVSGQWTIRLAGAYDDDTSGAVLYDSWLNPVAWGERSPESYRSINACLEAGRIYILEAAKAPASLQAAAYGPGRLPTPNAAAYPVLPASSGAIVRIARSSDTRYFRFTPPQTNTYRFYSSSPVEGGEKVDSYAFLLNPNGTMAASDDDVNYDEQLVQFDFTARLTAGRTYVLAVRAYVSPGQLSKLNPNLDFMVYVKPWGTPAQSAAIANVAISDKAVAALCDDNGALSDGIGAGGKLLGWGASLDVEHDGPTGIDFGEGLYALRRIAPQPLYVYGGGSFTKLWAVGHGFAARDSGGRIYAWGTDNEQAAFGVIRRLDNAVNGLARYEITGMAQGLRQNNLYFLDGPTGAIYSMEGLAGTPAAEPSPAFFTEIATSESCLFALDDEGGLWAKGPNRYGECGNGGMSAVSTLARIDLPEISGFAVGENHALALTAGGDVYAWGCNDRGSLGLGTVERLRATPAIVPVDALLSPGERVTKVFAGGNSSAALTSSGRVLAWGANDFGQLGIGSTFSLTSPVEVKALSPAALGGGKKTAGVVFGPESAYAVIGDGSLLVSGRNDSGQLGFLSATVKTFTKLSQPDLKSSNNRLLSLTLSAGALSPSFNPNTYEYNVKMPAGVALSMVSAVKADATASLAIDGKKVSSRTVNAGQGPIRMEIIVTAQDGSKQAYVLNFPQSRSADASLASVAISGGVLVAPLNAKSSSYTIVVPETVTGPVTIRPVAADPNASLAIDGVDGVASQTITLTGTQTAVMRVNVTAQLGNMRAYTFTVVRRQMLAAFSGAPVWSGYGAVSPGGTNRLALRYALNCPCAVKIEIKKGSVWYTVVNRTETAAGSKAYSWDGRLNGSALAAGTYAVRITPYFNGKAGTQKTMSVRILPKPGVTVSTLVPSTFIVDGAKTQKLAFKWTVLSDVKAEVVTGSGAVVRTLYSAANCLPGSKTLYWNGRSDAGSLLGDGTYRIRITCGATVYYKSFTVRR